MQTIIIVYLIVAALAFPIAYFWGRKRKIGFAWSFFFGTLLTPIASLLAIVLSPNLNERISTPSKTKRIIGRILLVVSSLGMLSGLGAEYNKTFEDYFSHFATFIGMIGLGIYLIKLGKGQ